MNPGRALRAAALLVAVVSAACGVPLMKLPADSGTPAPDTREALEQATTSCRAVRTFTAEIGVSGKVGARRLRARLLAGVAAPAQAFLDAPAPFGASVFQLAARGDNATLILPRDRRVLPQAKTADVIEAIAGIALGAEDLRIALTGCTLLVPSDFEVDMAPLGHSAGENWRIIPRRDEEIYLRRDSVSSPWRVAAVVRRPAGAGGPGGWRSEYQDFRNGLPSTVRFISLQPDRFDLRLSMSQVETNTTLDPDTFRLNVPAGFDPITLDELRQAGPLAEGERRQ